MPLCASANVSAKMSALAGAHSFSNQNQVPEVRLQEICWEAPERQNRFCHHIQRTKQNCQAAKIHHVRDN